MLRVDHMGRIVHMAWVLYMIAVAMKNSCKQSIYGCRNWDITIWGPKLAPKFYKFKKLVHSNQMRNLKLLRQNSGQNEASSCEPYL